MRSLLPTILLFSVLLQSSKVCAQTIISGKITNSDGWKQVLYLSELNRYKDIFSGSDALVIDSAIISKDGDFEFRSVNYKKGLYRLNLQPAGSSSMAGLNLGISAENYIHFYIDPTDKKIIVETDANYVNKNYNIYANPTCEKIQTIKELRSGFFAALDSNWAKINQSQDKNESEKERIRNLVMRDLMDTAGEMQYDLKIFMDTTTDVDAGLLASNYYNLGDDYSKYVAYFDTLAKKWRTLDAENKYLSGFIEEIDEFRNYIPIGSKAPGIFLPSISGDSLSLSYLSKKLILLDFWASWCGPCRIENKQTVLPLYKKYQPWGFEVLGISFDSDKTKWANAIKNDGYTWVHVIDTHGVSDSETGKNYKIKALPTTYLIDEYGTVIAKNLRGHQLEKFIEAYFDQ